MSKIYWKIPYVFKIMDKIAMQEQFAPWGFNAIDVFYDKQTWSFTIKIIMTEEAFETGVINLGILSEDEYENLCDMERLENYIDKIKELREKLGMEDL